MNDSDAQKLLIKAVKDLQKEFGEDVLTTLQGGSDSPVPCIPTGIPVLDAIIGQPGLPRGKITEFYGRESTGKSLTAAAIAAECVRNGLTVLYLDHEHSLDPAFLQKIGLQLGPKFLVASPNYMEESFAIALTMMKTCAIDLVILDSIGALVTQDTTKRKAGEQRPGEVSRVLSVCLAQTLPILSQSNAAFLVINHIRSAIGSFFSGETTSGGNALKYYCHVRIRLSRVAFLKDKNDIIGIEIKARVEKNKVAKPYKEGRMRMLFDSGIDKVGMLFEGLKTAGIVEVGSTGWIVSEALNIKMRGTDAFQELLKTDRALQDKALSLMAAAGQLAVDSSAIESQEIGDE